MIAEKPHRIAFGVALLLCTLYGLVIAGVIGTEKLEDRLRSGDTNVALFVPVQWKITTNWLVEPKDRLLFGPFPREQRYLEYGVVQSNLVAELVYSGKTQAITLESTPGMSITRSYKLTAEMIK